MKAFWITYALSTLALLGFVYSVLEVLPLCALVTVGAVASFVWLLWKQKALAKQRNLIPVALLASFGSVVSGFILILVLCIIGELFPRP